MRESPKWLVLALVACAPQRASAPIEPVAEVAASAPWACGAMPDDREIVVREHGASGELVRQLRVACDHRGAIAEQYEPSPEHEGWSDSAPIGPGVVRALWDRAQGVGGAECSEPAASSDAASVVLRIGRGRRTWACVPGAGVVRELAREIAGLAVAPRRERPEVDWSRELG